MIKNPYILEHGKLSNDILLNVAEILTLRLPEGAERIIAAKWVKKFLACDAKDYKNCLSLFISSLTKQMLVEPFNQAPPEPQDQWQAFAQEYSNTDIVRSVKARLFKDAKTPPYKIEISQDLQEYVAFQEIPFFGAHFYYAFSPTEKIHQWQKFNQLKVPKKYVQALELGDPPQSPIKGRISSRQGNRAVRKRGQAAPGLLIQKPRVVMRPQWEAAEEDEEAPAEPPRRTSISIPTDGPVRAIPSALQARMVEAEQQKQQRAAMKEQEQRRNATRPKTKTPSRTPPVRTKKPKYVARLPNQASGSRTPPAERPQWEGGDDEEEPVEEPERRTMITIPTDAPVRNIPAALQRRMLEAEREKKEREALRQQENRKKDARLRTPVRRRSQPSTPESSRPAASGAPQASSGGFSSPLERRWMKPPAQPAPVRTPRASRASRSLYVRVLKRNASRSGVHMRDSIDEPRRVTISPSANIEVQVEPEPEPEPEPMDHGPMNRMEYIKHVLAESKRNAEFASAQPNAVDEDLVEQEASEQEAEQEAEQQVEQQVNSIVENAAVIDEELKDVMFELKSLNEAIAKPVIAPDTIKKFNDFRARTGGFRALLATQDQEGPTIALNDDEASANAEQVLNLLNRSFEVAQEAVASLSQVQPGTSADKKAIENLIAGNHELMEEVEAVAQPLIDAIEDKDFNLNNLSVEAVAYLRRSIQKSNENDDKLTENLEGTPAVLQAVDIEDDRNDQLEDVLEDARKRTNKVLRIARQFEGGQAANDSSILKFMGQNSRAPDASSLPRFLIQDDDDVYDLIDVNDADLEFEGGVIDDEEFQKLAQEGSRTARERAFTDEAAMIQREKARFSSMFASINNDDNLDNVTNNFNGLLDESLELMDHLADDLSDLMQNAGNQNEFDAIQDVVNRVVESINVLERSREEVNAAQGDTGNQFDALLDSDDNADPHFIIFDSDDGI